MAISFKLKTGSVTTTAAVHLTAAKQTIVTGASISNKGSANTTVAVWVEKVGVIIGDIIRNGAVPVGSALIVAGGSSPKITLEAGDKIVAQAINGASAMDFLISYAEID